MVGARRAVAGRVVGVAFALVASLTVVAGPLASPAGAAELTSGVAPRGVVGTWYSHQLRSDVAGATWSVTSGSLPAGLTLDAATGVVSGVPTTAGSVVFGLQATNGTDTATASLYGILVDDGPAVTPASPGTAQFGQAYSTSFAGNRPGTWTLGAGAPSWASIDPATGELTGTPDAVGDVTFDVELTPDARATKVAAGESHTCALDAEDGSIDCWGANGFGQATDDPGPFTDLAVGDNHTCGILASSGHITCWGWNVDGQADLQTGPFTSVTAGRSHTCAIVAADGSARCWGSSADGRDADPAGPFTQISAGQAHTCGILAADGSVQCWGFDAFGETAAQTGPFERVTAGELFTCGVLAADDSVTCWGRDNAGQATGDAGPVIVADAGDQHRCVIDPVGATRCAGDNSAGQSDPQTGPSIAISAGDDHTCTIAERYATLDCWGSDASGKATPPASFNAAVTESVTISVAAPTVTSGLPASGDFATPYTHTFTASAPGAAWSVESGSLPGGLTLDPGTGELAGTPTADGTYGPITIEAAWSAGSVTATQDVTIVIGGPAITSTPPTDGDYGQPYTHTFTADTPDSTWTIAAGTLPEGLTLDPTTGQLAGTPTEIGTFGPITVRAGWASFDDVAAGRNHSCALAPDGSIDCWGDDSLGQATDQTGPYTAMSTGWNHTCAIVEADGSVDCWGANTNGQATDQTGPYTAVSAGRFHTCAIVEADASIDCWGANGNGQATDQTGPYTQVSAGNLHTCGIVEADGSIDCWGANGFGQDADQPGPYTDVAAGGFHTCGILEADGSVDCWGDNGSGRAEDQTGPYTHVTTGYLNTCGILATDGDAHCWGVDTDGQSTTPDAVTATQDITITINGPTITSPTPPDGAFGQAYTHTFTASAPGVTWSIASGTLPDGLSLDPSTGELSGTPNETGSIGPVTIQAGWPGEYVDVATGGSHSCALVSDGSIDCWGADTVGQATDQIGPYTAVAAGGNHSCGILAADGSVDCWGWDIGGQATDQTGPYTQVSAGNLHTCGILAADGSADCWGTSSFGSATDQIGPYTHIAAGGNHTCGILEADGSIDCWGFDGDGQATDQTGPYTAVAAGGNHSCGILAADGSVDCWGGNTSGQATDQTGPYAYVETGDDHTCGILAVDGSIDCWGSNSTGQAADQAGPYTAVATGGRHTCGILAADGAIDCWGQATNGQATDQPAPTVVTATQDVTITIAAPTITSGAPADGDYGQAYSHTFSASAPGATWAVTSGRLPTGVVLDPSTGELAGTPVEHGTFGATVVEASWPGTSATAAQGITLTIAAPTVTSGAPPDGDYEQAYSHTFTASAPDATWTITSGALPEGLSLDAATGELTGTPTEPGTYGPVTIEARWGGVLAISGGDDHTCALLGDGSIDCWGDNSSGQAADKTGPYTAVAAGYYHTCGILEADGSIDCWGDNQNGKATDQTGPYTAVSADDSHTCAILAADGSIDCWGRNDYGQATDQTGPYTAVATGYYHSCGILAADGSIDCWGRNGEGQATDQTGPYTAVAAGGSHSCGILAADGSIDCWGFDIYGAANDQTGPYTAVTAGYSHTCGLRATDSSIHCWGDNSDGQAADQTGPYTAVAAGGFGHSCGVLAAGPIDCWGDNSNGQAADQPTKPLVTVTQDITLTIAPPTITSAEPTDPVWDQPYSHTFTASAPGATWSVASGTLPDGVTLDPTTGELSGTPTEIGSFGPVTVRAEWGEQLVELDAGLYHSCARSSSGSVDCWGLNADGQSDPQTGPYRAISAGGFHTCGILEADGSIDCWGDNADGQATDQTGPYTAVSAGGYHTCGILEADGSIDCWGYEADGQAVDQLGPYTAVAAGTFHTCGIHEADGSIDCWGYNSTGQAVDQPGPYTAVAAGTFHTCGILEADGSIDCWGRDSFGEGADQPGPYTAVSVGGDHTCGILAADDSIHCQGRDNYGQTTDQPGPSTHLSIGSYHSCAILAADGSVDCWGDITYDQATDQPSPAPIAGQVFSFDVVSPPSIWPVGAKTMDQDTTLDVLFAVWDSDHLPVDLTVTVGSDDQALLPDAGLVLSGSPTVAWRTLSITPAAGQIGTANVTITVTDPDGFTASRTFAVSVQAPAASLSGTLTGPSGEPADGVTVTLVDAYNLFSVAGTTHTAADGTWSIDGLDPGLYKLRYWDYDSRYRITWHADATTHSTATPIWLTLTDHTVIDAQLDVLPQGALVGQVTDATDTPLEGILVQVFSTTDGYVRYSRTNADGLWLVSSLTPGDYTVRFIDLTGTHPLQWHDGQTSAATATPITVTTTYEIIYTTM